MIRKMSCLALVFLLIVVLAPSAGAASVEMLMPLYIYPLHWDPAYAWDDIAVAAGRIPITAVINPANGPGGAGDPNSDYQTGMADLYSGEVTLVGYNPTDWGARDQADVTADTNKYHADYRNPPTYDMAGIFFDEVSTSSDTTITDYYSQAAATVTGLPSWGTVLFNPGTNAPEIYADMSDILVVFENSYSSWLAYTPDPYLADRDSSEFAMIVHGVSTIAEMQVAIDLALNRNIGHVFVTDNYLYNTMPLYWDEMVDYIEEVNAVPISSTSLLFGSGLVGLVLVRRRSAVSELLGPLISLT